MLDISVALPEGRAGAEPQRWATMLTLGGIAFDDAAALLRSYALALQRVADGDPIPGGYWGDSEAGIIGATVYARRHAGALVAARGPAT